MKKLSNSQKYCKKCAKDVKLKNKQDYYKDNPDKKKEHDSKYYQKNKKLLRNKMNTYTIKKRKDVRYALWERARDRAKKKNMEFNISLSDIYVPNYCPILGMKLERHKNKKEINSPSLDRIDNNKGYIKGNIIVISSRANELKRDATVEELEAIVTFFKELQQ